MTKQRINKERKKERFSEGVKMIIIKPGVNIKDGYFINKYSWRKLSFLQKTKSLWKYLFNRRGHRKEINRNNCVWICYENKSTGGWLKKLINTLNTAVVYAIFEIGIIIYAGMIIGILIGTWVLFVGLI